MWSREEALSTIASMEMVDLPVSEVEAKMEEEFGSKKSSKCKLYRYHKDLHVYQFDLTLGTAVIICSTCTN